MMIPYPNDPKMERPVSGVKWQANHCDAKLKKLTRTIRQLQMVLVMALLEEVPLIALNSFLLYNFDQIRPYWAFSASVIWSFFQLGYHLSLLNFLKEAYFQHDKLKARIDLLEDKLKEEKNLGVVQGIEGSGVPRSTRNIIVEQEKKRK